MRTKIFKLCALVALAAPAPFAPALAADPLVVKVGVLRVPHSRETISILDAPADDETLAGAKLGADDNNTTGEFTNQKFETIDEKISAADDVAAAVGKLADQGVGLVIADLPVDKLLTAADAGKPRGMVFINSGSGDDSLRGAQCRANLFHAAPSRAMLADALAQYLLLKQWRRWALVKGSHPEDEALAADYRAAAKKFGAKIVDEREFKDTGGGRRSDTGVVQTQQMMTVATQNEPAYDVMVAADESQVFAGYLPYRTWDARPVVGSAGLTPTTWDPSHEQWGATQLNNRFERLFRRPLRSRDAQAWMAMRMIGEAATRTNSGDPKSLAAYMASPKFEIAAFKGQKLTVRDWDLQLRQPILLTDGRTVVSVSPQQGFLNPTSTLDTLGKDRPETTCKLK